MSRFGTLEELVSKVERYADDNYDAEVVSTDLQVAGDQLSLHNMEQWEDHTVTIEPHAFTQLSDRIDGPPQKWMLNRGKCDEVLQDSILNYQLQSKDPKKFLVRGSSNGDGLVARAVMSNQYRPLDNIDLFPMIQSALDIAAEEQGVPLSTITARTTVTRDYVRTYILFPEIKVDVDDPRSGNGGGGTLKAGVFTRNGEIGNSGIAFLPCSWSDVCQNGSIYGLRNEKNDKAGFAGGKLIHRWHDRDVMIKMVATAIGHALRLSPILNQKYVEAYEIDIADNALTRLIGEWKEKRQLTDDQAEAWEHNTRMEAGTRGSDAITWGDLINGVTVLSHTTDEGEQRDLYDGMGGDLIRQLFGLPAYAEIVEQEFMNI